MIAHPLVVPKMPLIDPPVFIRPQEVKEAEVQKEETAAVVLDKEAGEPAAEKATMNINRGMKFIGEVAKGAIGGYAGYWLMRGIEKLGFMGPVGTNGIRPLPYILSGMAIYAVTELASIIYDLAREILGHRVKYEGVVREEKTRLDRFRCHSWKVISKLERAQEKVDEVYSKIFRIRTAKQLRLENAGERDLFFMEVVRRAFLEQVGETASLAIPQELGVYFVEAFGIAVTGGHMLGLHGLMFVTSLINSVTTHYKKIMDEDEAIEKAAKAKDDFETEMSKEYNEMPLNKLPDHQQLLRQKLQKLIDKAEAMKDNKKIEPYKLKKKMIKAIDKAFASEHEIVKKYFKVRSLALLRTDGEVSEKLKQFHQEILTVALEVNALGMASLEKIQANATEQSDIAVIEKELAEAVQEKELYENKINV